jgi:hypothetical protein
MRSLSSLLLVLAAFGTSASGQLIPPENPEPWSYVAPPLEGLCLQTYRLYLPRDLASIPPDGWPVLVDLDMKAFAITLERPVDHEDVYGRLLSQGFAVIKARATPGLPPFEFAPDGSLALDEHGNPIPNVGFQNAYGNECNVSPGVPPIWPGHGIFHAPGVVPPDLVGTGIAPYDSPDYPMAEKDAVMLIQHVRHMARKSAPFANAQEELMSQLDHRRISVKGTSAGAAALMWAVLGADRRNEAPFAGLGGQYDEPTQANVAFLGGALMWWPMFRPDLKLVVSHFGFQGDSEFLPSPMLLGDALTDDRQAASPLFFADPDQAAALPMYLQYSETSISEDYEGLQDPFFCQPYDFCFDDQGLEGFNVPGGTGTAFHPAWSGYTWKTLHPDTTRLVIHTPEAFAQSNGVPAIPIYDGSFMQDTDAILWLGDRMDELIPWAAAPSASVFPGTKVHGLLPDDGVHSVALDAVAGTTLSARLVKKAGDLVPSLRVVAPDGSWLLAPGDTVLNPKKAAVQKLVLPQTGTYRIEVLGMSLPGGEYRLRTKAASPGKLKNVLTVGFDDGSETLSFDAVAGTVISSVKISNIKPPKGAAGSIGGLPANLLPEVVGLMLPGGGAINLVGLVKTSSSGKKVKVGKVVLPVTGTYSLTLTGAEDSVGYAAVGMKLRRPKGGQPVEIF